MLVVDLMVEKNEVYENIVFRINSIDNLFDNEIEKIEK